MNRLETPITKDEVIKVLRHWGEMWPKSAEFTEDHAAIEFMLAVLVPQAEKPSVEWVLNELHVIEQCQLRVEGEQNSSAVALRRAIELIRKYQANRDKE